MTDAITAIIEGNTCEWFANCTNEAAGTVEHPILGPVPCCERCATKLDLTLTRPSRAETENAGEE